MAKDPYFRLLEAGIRPDCAAHTIDYYLNFRDADALERYISKLENKRVVSDR